jgi:hypothetical protein
VLPAARTLKGVSKSVAAGTRFDAAAAGDEISGAAFVAEVVLASHALGEEPLALHCYLLHATCAVRRVRGHER